jgi:hypothetical protein
VKKDIADSLFLPAIGLHWSRKLAGRSATAGGGSFFKSHSFQIDCTAWTGRFGALFDGTFSAK